MSIKASIKQLKKDISNIPTYWLDLDMLDDDELSILTYFIWSDEKIPLPKVFEDKLEKAYESGKRKKITIGKYTKDEDLTNMDDTHEETMKECKEIYDQYVQKYGLDSAG